MADKAEEFIQVLEAVCAKDIDRRGIEDLEEVLQRYLGTRTQRQTHSLWLKECVCDGTTGFCRDWAVGVCGSSPQSFLPSGSPPL